MTIASALAGLPDNVLRLISPLAARSIIAALAPFVSSRVPNADDDEVDTNGVGNTFAIGQFWLEQPFQTLWVCLSGTENMAVWVLIGPPPAPSGSFDRWVYEPATDTVTQNSLAVTPFYSGVGTYTFTLGASRPSSSWPVSISFWGAGVPYVIEGNFFSDNVLSVNAYDLAGAPADPYYIYFTTPN